MPARPTLFIGSSTESRDVAFAAQECLEDCTEPIVWSQAVFNPSQFILESLLDALDDARFGLFVFAPDDVTNIRGRELRTTRDNVVFELGLFIGRLGRERSFILMPMAEPPVRLPIDLAGVNATTFVMPADPNRLVAALGPACHRIRRAITNAIANASRAQAPVPSPDEASDLALALSLAMPEARRKHLVNLAEGRTKDYRGRGSLRAELRDLVSLGLLENLPGKPIEDMKWGTIFDLADFVKLTDGGKRWVEKITPLRSRPQASGN